MILHQDSLVLTNEKGTKRHLNNLVTIPSALNPKNNYSTEGILGLYSMSLTGFFVVLYFSE
jgi:hypothetical protein